MRSRNPSAAFSLLELLVVLAILSIVTALAVRSLDGVEDQRRYEATRRGFEQLEAAVIGSSDDRAPDGSRTVTGFVADMGRLPEAIGRIIGGQSVLTLDELLAPNGPADFAVRRAQGAAIDLPADADSDVWVAGGWRGPYIRLPQGAATLLDGWGNPYVSPVSGSEPSPRLLDAAGNPLTASGQAIGSLRHLGADGQPGGDAIYDDDEPLDFAGNLRATLTGRVEVIEEGSDDTLAPPDPAEYVTVRVFGPNPANATQVSVIARTTVQFKTNPLSWTIPAVPAGSTVGPRMVRAYLHTLEENAAANAMRRSVVKAVTVRPGTNVVDFKIDR